MVRSTSRWFALTLAVAVVLAAGTVPSEAKMRQAPLERLKTELGLSDDQVSAIRQYHDGQREARKQFFQSLREARRTLREMVLTGAADTAIQNKTAEVQTLMAQGVELRVQSMRHLAQVLTPEQREKLKELPRPMWR